MKRIILNRFNVMNICKGIISNRKKQNKANKKVINPPFFKTSIYTLLNTTFYYFI